MVVDVVCLWFQGKKVPIEEVKAARPYRGELMMSRSSGTDILATFKTLAGTEPLLALIHAKVTVLRGDDFLIVGTEV